MAETKLTLVEEEKSIIRSALSQMRSAALRNATKAILPELKAAHDRAHVKISALLAKLEAL